MTRHGVCAQHEEENRLASHLPEQREKKSTTKKSKKHQSSYETQHSHVIALYIFTVQSNLSQPFKFVDLLPRGAQIFCKKKGISSMPSTAVFTVMI